jgi:hypothetical protein
MLRTLKNLGKRLRIGSLQRGDMTSASERPVENTDAMSAAKARMPDSQAGSLPGTVPPNYIKTYDEGRPRH